MEVKIREDILLSDNKLHTLAIFNTDDNELYVMEVKGRFDISGNDYEKICEAFYTLEG